MHGMNFFNFTLISGLLYFITLGDIHKELITPSLLLATQSGLLFPLPLILLLSHTFLVPNRAIPGRNANYLENYIEPYRGHHPWQSLLLILQ